MEQFGRKYRLQIGGREVGCPLRISFRIEKTDTQTPDTARITLWNLSPETIAALNEEDCLITLFAGYETFMPMAFRGVVTYAQTNMEGSDRETTIEAQDCRRELRDTYVSFSYSGIVNSRDIIEDIAGEMGLAVNFSHNARFHDYPKGIAFVCPARTALDTVCASSNLRWRAENGVLEVKINRDTMSRDLFLLSPDSGLIGFPKKLTYGGDRDGTDFQTGWQAEYFLNGAIRVDDYVKLESSLVKGHFRVLSVDMRGDSWQGDWICSAKLMEA